MAYEKVGGLLTMDCPDYVKHGAEAVSAMIQPAPVPPATPAPASAPTPAPSAGSTETSK
jgi:hypothetical protein